MKTRLSILLLIFLFLSGCGATTAPTATPDQNTPTVLPPQEPTSTVPIVTPTMTTAILPGMETSVTPESTMTLEATATIAQVQMTVLSDGKQTSQPQSGVCQQPSNWVAYTVQASDTLSSLGQRTGTGWQQIQSANCLTSTMILAGQVLLLPYIPAPPVGITEVVEPPDAPPPGNPRLEVVPGSGPAGTTFIFKIRDFDPFAIITVKIESSKRILISSFPITMDAKGNFDVAWVSPSGLAIGLYSVRPFRPDGTQGKRGTFGIVGSYP